MNLSDSSGNHYRLQRGRAVPDTFSVVISADDSALWTKFRGADAKVSRLPSWLRWFAELLP